MVTIVGNGHGDKNLDEAVHISHSPWEMYESSNSPSSNGLIERKTPLFSFGYATSLEEGILWIQPCYHHHHHHIVLVARISLTLSRHSSLSLIALGRSSRQHPVSSHSCWMYVRAGRPAFHVPRKQRRINRKGHRNEANESMDSYQ